MSSRPYVAELEGAPDKYRRLTVNSDGELIIDDTSLLLVLSQILAAIENLSPPYLFDQNGDVLVDQSFNVLAGG